MKKDIIDYGLEHYLISSDEMVCQQCYEKFGEGDTFEITMLPHDEGNVESGPSPPSILILCKACAIEIDAIGENE